MFLAALEIERPEARAAFLKATCNQDVALRRRLEELLKEHFSNDSLLAGPALDDIRPLTGDSPAPESGARMLGRYKLLEKIGEGGFGEVWMAEQREPIRRRVAVKIIKPGMDNRANILGFTFSPQGDELAVSTKSGVQLWSTKAWTCTRELPDFTGILYATDGRCLWLSKSYRSAGLFDARTLEPLLPLPVGMLPLALSSDDRFLVVNVDSRRLQVWDLPKLRRQLGNLGLGWAD